LIKSTFILGQPSVHAYSGAGNVFDPHPKLAFKRALPEVFLRLTPIMGIAEKTGLLAGR
jgi:hypothetical protein